MQAHLIAPRPARPTLVLFSALLWVLALAVLSGYVLVYNASLEGPPAIFSSMLPAGIAVLVAWLYGLIRQL